MRRVDGRSQVACGNRGACRRSHVAYRELLLLVLLAWSPAFAANDGTWTINHSGTLGAYTGIAGDAGSVSPYFWGSGYPTYVSIPSAVWFSGGDWSVEYWIYQDANGDQQTIYDFGNYGGSASDDIAGAIYSGYQFSQEVYQGSTSGGVCYKNLSPAMSLHVWNHVVLTYVASTTTWTLYVNGTPIGTHAEQAPLNVTRAVNYIGRVVAAWFGTGYFAYGSLAHFAVYDRALGSTEIGTHYSTGSTAGTGYKALIIAAAPLAYWRLAETSGTTAHDEMGAAPPSAVHRPRSRGWVGW